MKLLKASLLGLLLWFSIFLLFTVFSFIPSLKAATIIQYVILYIYIVPIVYLIGRYYYKAKINFNAWLFGIILVVTGLFLDAIITVPLVIIPEGGSYIAFFTDPFLWILIAEVIGLSIVFYKRFKPYEK